MMSWVPPRTCHWDCVFFLLNFCGMKRTCWTTGSWRRCLSVEVANSIPAGSTIIHGFLCGFICVSLCHSINIKPTNMHIARARAQLKINTHVLKLTPGHSRRVINYPLSRPCHWYCFLHNFCGMKRMCWTTGRWRCCLSLAVASSIPAGSTIIHGFLCGFICVSLCQSINIKPTNIKIQRNGGSC